MGKDDMRILAHTLRFLPPGSAKAREAKCDNPDKNFGFYRMSGTNVPLSYVCTGQTARGMIVSIGFLTVPCTVQPVSM